MKWSHLQDEIFDTAADFGVNFAIEARAGTGKSTTVLEVATRSGLGQKLLFLAFNKSIVQHLQRKTNNTDGKNPNAPTCSTLHSLGFSALKRNVPSIGRGWNVDDKGEKYKAIFEDMGLPKLYPEMEKWDALYTFDEIISKMMVTLTPPDPDAMTEMADTYTVNIPGDIEQAARLCAEAIAIGRNSTFTNGVVNFNEMIYWPAMEHFDIGRYHTVIVDEAQDLNACQHQLIDLISRNRMIVVGDTFQSIYMFAGARANSMNILKQRFELLELPLNVSYRCGRKIILHAQEIVPDIEYWEGAGEGELKDVPRRDLIKHLGGDVAIICRTNAPLINTCFQLITQGVRAKIKGKDIARQLMGQVYMLAKRKGFKMATFPGHLEEWRQKETMKIVMQGRRRSAVLLGIINDKVACLMALYDNIAPSSIDEFAAGIKAIFTDEANPGVLLMSGHKSKGLEFDRVFLLEPQKVPLTWNGQSEEQYQQEQNLNYVIRTRARHEYITLSDYEDND